MDKVLANPLDCALLMFIFGSILHYFTLTSHVDLRKDIPCFWCLLLVPAPTFDPCISISFSLVLAPWDRAFGIYIRRLRVSLPEQAVDIDTTDLLRL